MLPEGTSHREEENADKRLRFVKGNLSSVGIWSKAFPDRADAIIVLGEGDIPTDGLPVLIRTADQSELRQVPIFSVRAGGEGVTRQVASADPLFQIISISSDKLQDVVKRMAWDRTSLQYALLNRLITLFDDKVGFPTLSERTGSTEPAGRLATFLKSKAKGRFTVEQNERHSIRIVPDEDNAAVNEVHMMQAVGAAFQEDPDAASHTNVFLYVETLDLLRWNDIFAADIRDELQVLAIRSGKNRATRHEVFANGINSRIRIASKNIALAKRIDQTT